MFPTKVRRPQEGDHHDRNTCTCGFPLDKMSASCRDDSTASLSSMGSTDDDVSLSPSSPPRCIFRCYWDKSKLPPPMPILSEHSIFRDRKTSSTLEDTVSRGELDDGLDYYGHYKTSTPEDIEGGELQETPSVESEESSQQDEGPRTPPQQGPLVERRRIFDPACFASEHGSQSSPVLGSEPDPPAPLRTCYSTSELDQRREKLTSCLRSPGEQGRKRSNSVSFSPQVDVVEFKVPKETWDTKGWFSLFT